MVDAAAARTLYRALESAIAEGLVASCHDCSDGGLGVALAEAAFAGGLGMEVDLRAVPARDVTRNDYLLFSESQSRFVVTVHPEAREKFETCLKGMVFAKIGTVTAERELQVMGFSGKVIVSEDVDALKRAWRKPLDF